jgi:uncharacterized OB-fold protein
MAESSPSFLLPAPDEESAPFWEGCSVGELRVQACASCGRRRFPARPMCPWCRSFDDEWQVMSGRGRIWSFAIPHPPLLPAYAEVAPYNVVIVELEDDPTIRLVGNVVEAPGAPLNSVDPWSLEIGQVVEVVFDRVTDDIAMPRWVLG